MTKTVAALSIGWIVGFVLLAIGAGWLAPIAAFAITFALYDAL